MTIPRKSGKPGLRYINWSPYIRLLADKPAAMYNFSFLNLFEGNDLVIEKITKLEETKLQTFLYSFANMIDDIGIDEAVKKETERIISDFEKNLPPGVTVREKTVKTVKTGENETEVAVIFECSENIALAYTQ